MTVEGVAGDSGLGNGLVSRPSEVEIVIEGRGGDGEAHGAQLGDDVLGALERLGAQPAAEAAGLVDHRLQAELHQLEGGHEAGDAGADDRHLGAVAMLRHAAEAGRMLTQLS